MGLMLARTGHAMKSTPVVAAGSFVGASAVMLGTQWGWGADFSKSERPSLERIGGTLAGGVIAGIASASAVKKQNAASVAAGNMRLAAIGGAVGASLIGVPVVRRFIAGE